MHLLYLNLFLLFTIQSETAPCFEYIADVCYTSIVKPKGLNKVFINNKITDIKNGDEMTKKVDGEHKN